MTSTPIFTTAATAAAAAADLGPESVQRKRLVRYFAGNRGVLLLLKRHKCFRLLEFSSKFCFTVRFAFFRGRPLRADFFQKRRYTSLKCFVFPKFRQKRSDVTFNATQCTVVQYGCVEVMKWRVPNGFRDWRRIDRRWYSAEDSDVIVDNLASSAVKPPLPRKWNKARNNNVNEWSALNTTTPTNARHKTHRIATDPSSF